MTAHTPGPWEVNPVGQHLNMRILISSPTHGSIAQITASEDERANSRLIADAPDLLAAAKTVLHELVELWAGDQDGDRLADILRAAIAKAEGKE